MHINCTQVKEAKDYSRIEDLRGPLAPCSDTVSFVETRPQIQRRHRTNKELGKDGNRGFLTSELRPFFPDSLIR